MEWEHKFMDFKDTQASILINVESELIDDGS